MVLFLYLEIDWLIDWSSSCPRFYLGFRDLSQKCSTIFPSNIDSFFSHCAPLAIISKCVLFSISVKFSLIYVFFPSFWIIFWTFFQLINLVFDNPFPVWVCVCVCISDIYVYIIIVFMHITCLKASFLLGQFLYFSLLKLLFIYSPIYLIRQRNPSCFRINVW